MSLPKLVTEQPRLAVSYLCAMKASKDEASCRFAGVKWCLGEFLSWSKSCEYTSFRRFLLNWEGEREFDPLNLPHAGSNMNLIA